MYVLENATDNRCNGMHLLTSQLKLISVIRKFNKEAIEFNLCIGVKGFPMNRTTFVPIVIYLVKKPINDIKNTRKYLENNKQIKKLYSVLEYISIPDLLL